MYREAASCFVDEKIADASRYENWFIPLKTTGARCPLKYTDDQWTLLTFYVRNNRWAFYNSIVPAAGKDVHLISSGVLVSFLFCSLLPRSVWFHITMIRCGCCSRCNIWRQDWRLTVRRWVSWSRLCPVILSGPVELTLPNSSRERLNLAR